MINPDARAPSIVTAETIELALSADPAAKALVAGTTDAVAAGTPDRVVSAIEQVQRHLRQLADQPCDTRFALTIEAAIPLLEAIRLQEGGQLSEEQVGPFSRSFLELVDGLIGVGLPLLSPPLAAGYQMLKLLTKHVPKKPAQRS